MSTTPPPASPPPRRPSFVVIAWLTLMLLAAAALVAWLLLAPNEPSAAAVAADLRGVGLMEQHKFQEAVGEFEKAVAAAPKDRTFRINLAIARMNEDSDANRKQAVQEFEAILKEDPDNPYAHYCLGIMGIFSKDNEQALAHFEAVTRKDPGDAGAWYQLGSLLLQLDRDRDRAIACLRKARELDPAHVAALYGLSQALRDSDPAESDRLLAEMEKLKAADWFTETAIKYTDMGSKYAEVIGGRAEEAPTAGPPPTFARDGRFKTDLTDGKPLIARPERFGEAIVLFDYDGDGRPDLLLPDGRDEPGKRAVLLRNEDGWRFVETTGPSGLAFASMARSAAAADFDNDGRPDLLAAGLPRPTLLRNVGGTFADTAKEAGLDLAGNLYGSTPVDLDQDGDLDFVICQQPIPGLALEGVQVPKSEGGLAVFLNVGEAPPGEPNKPPPALTWKFRRLTEPAALLGTGPTVAVALSDLDGDRDVDLVVFTDDQPPAFVRNDRLLRFERSELPGGAGVAKWNGAAVLDADGDGRPDLLLLPAGEKPFLLRNRSNAAKLDFEKVVLDAPPLRQAHVADFDLDGRQDVAGVSDAGVVVVLQNVSGRLVTRAAGLEDSPRDVAGMAVGDYDGDARPDLVLWSKADGLVGYRGGENGNRGLPVALVGRREKSSSLRTANDALGARVLAHAGRLTTAVENTTFTAGLGQSRLPLLLGLGKAERADVLRVRWPEGIVQAELDLPAGKVARVEETNRKGTSCPVLLAWNGSRWGYVTDFLGAGALGEMTPDGKSRPPVPYEAVKLEPGQLVPGADGTLRLQITEPMDEFLYLDAAELVAFDHPEGSTVDPDERFVVSSAPPTREIHRFDRQYHATKAIDHRGRDVTAILSRRDGTTADGFRRRSWLGYAEEHAVELDFGDTLAEVKPGTRLFLRAAGWTDYPYPESIFAATQAGVPLIEPVLERWDGAKWVEVGVTGFPAGLPKAILREVTGLPTGSGLKLRLRTNLQVYWDEVALSPLVEKPSAIPVPLREAVLGRRGVLRELTDGDGQPQRYDPERTEAVPVTRWRGPRTRFGDVTPLAKSADDQLVLCGPGEAVTLVFNGTGLPPVRAGWQRSFVLRATGYCKDTAPFTATGGSTLPLPFRGMSRYPYGPEEQPAANAAHGDQAVRWHTR